MDAKTCLEKLKLVGVLSFATVDGSGAPQIRCVSAVHFDDESFYFFTARGKNFAASCCPTAECKFSPTLGLKK